MRPRWEPGLRTASLERPGPPYGLAGSALASVRPRWERPGPLYGFAGSALGSVRPRWERPGLRTACAACAACAADSVNVWKQSKQLPSATEVLFRRKFGNSQNSLRVLPHCIDTELLVDGIDRSRLVYIKNIS